jgi:hypothetical protein
LAVAPGELNDRSRGSGFLSVTATLLHTDKSTCYAQGSEESMCAADGCDAQAAAVERHDASDVTETRSSGLCPTPQKSKRRGRCPCSHVPNLVCMCAHSRCPLGDKNAAHIYAKISSRVHFLD